eukprot:CAMPEP_0194284952 /NCGR_PEP_ID=MMETSP0169-20130528/28987_1 /TAXON_ID=218684 /ORGANISM="Corethron pennatum, Strain L29A3" /LENGTH=210 /DNA_ID=CAMNT_0039030939 /DNA_START=309 /DNA_END=941 /DNA_ORIENTATION=-
MQDLPDGADIVQIDRVEFGKEAGSCCPRTPAPEPPRPQNPGLGRDHGGKVKLHGRVDCAPLPKFYGANVVAGPEGDEPHEPPRLGGGRGGGCHGPVQEGSPYLDVRVVQARKYPPDPAPRDGADKGRQEIVREAAVGDGAPGVVRGEGLPPEAVERQARVGGAEAVERMEDRYDGPPDLPGAFPLPWRGFFLRPHAHAGGGLGRRGHVLF